MKKAQKIFLYVGIIIIAVSTVIISVDAFNEIKNSYQHAIKNDVYKNMAEFWYWNLLGTVLFSGPLILSEASVIKNIYSFLGKDQTKATTIFRIISLLLAVIALILLFVSKNDNFMYHVQQNYTLASWFALIISFIVGSIKIKR